jgi:uncharacterized membrane protein YdjX (TVP38/TMEM64 family)
MYEASERIRASGVPRSTLIWIVAVGLALVALFALWRFTPLQYSISTRNVARWAREFGESPWAPVIVLVAYTPASVLMFPRPLINVGSIVAFGTWLGSAYALAGILLSGLASYVVGRAVKTQAVRRFVGERVYGATRHVRRGGIPALTAVRLVPVAPFVVINLIAGAARVGVFSFSAGTVLGMIPGVAGAAIIGTALRRALDQPAAVDWRIIAAIAALTIIAALLLHLLAGRRLRAMRQSNERP